MHGLLYVFPAQRLGQEQEAVEAQRLGLVEALGPRVGALRRQAPEMNDEARLPSAVPQGLQQRNVIAPAARVDLELVLSRDLEGRARLDRRHPLTRCGELLGKDGAKAGLV